MKLGIVITVHNRPEYTAQCFESLKRADIPERAVLCVVDDCSTDKNIPPLVTDFMLKTACFVVRLGEKTQGVKSAILEGVNQLQQKNCDLICILDNDAIVNNEAFNWLLYYHKQYPDRIITGFNCNTLNKDGSERHVNLSEGNGITFKQSAGGVNMLFNKAVYQKYILPALEGPGNWDHEACKAMMKDEKPIVAIKPSVVQHIGIKSAMGHNADRPDVADDFKPLSLFDVTLIGVSGNDIDNLIRAAHISTRDIHFADVKLLTSLKRDHPWIVPIKEIKSKAAYNQYILKEVVDHVHTSHFLIIQPDGYVLNWKAWSNEFLEYDYIGARWFWYKEGHVGGNGGFSLRSKKLHDILKTDPKIKPVNDRLIKSFEEDHNISNIYGKYLQETYGIKFAPAEIADKFSIEAYGLKHPLNKYKGSFGFHATHVNFNDAKREFGIDHIPYSHPNRQHKIIY